MGELLSVREAAVRLGCSTSLLQKRCKDGSIPSIMLGSDYRIDWDDLQSWVRRSSARAKDRAAVSNEQMTTELQSEVEAWLNYMTCVKACSPRTIELYQSQLRTYLKRMTRVGETKLSIKSLFDRRTVMQVFSRIPAHSYSTKMNTYLALKSFGTFLVEEGRLELAVLDELKPLKPRRQVEPRRTHLKPDDVQRLLDHVLTRPVAPAENLTFAAMLACMAYAGLRVSEVCNLTPKTVDLDGRTLTIIHGKHGKNRRVGISNALYSYLVEYNRIRRSGPTYFLRDGTKPWTKAHAAKRLRVISKRLGVDITCHGLRRTFATLAANQGRSINSIRIALGHANLETTQAYLRTSEAEVVEAMKGW